MSSYTIYFDTETGGVQPHHPTIQLAAIAWDDEARKEVAEFEVKIAFNEADADPVALEINHYRAEDWMKASESLVAAKLFSDFVRPYSSVKMISKRTQRPYYVAKLAGYNALTFDLPRLKEMFSDMFFPCAYIVRDVLQRALFYFDEHDEPKPANMKLSTVAAHFGIVVDGAHDALADARIAALLMDRLCR